MLNLLKGYTIFGKINEGITTTVYRGERILDRQPVTIAITEREYPQFRELIALRNQYLILKNLAIDGIIKIYSLEKCGNGLALVMEDVTEIYLSDYLESTLSELKLSNFLAIAINLVTILERLDPFQIVHQKINPRNILIAPQTQQVKLLDFSAAAVVPKTKQLEPNLDLLGDSLPYIAPEQTGRIESGIDRRTDFYALGVTFYQLLTGRLPFIKTEPMELIHCHLAVAPTPPQTIKPDLPSVLSDMVLKLMAKNPEHRYQTVLGLKRDLVTCREQLTATERIENFELGLRDLCDRLVIPEKLYGREQEREILLKAYRQTTAGKPSLVLVTGDAGVGKTALVDCLSQPIWQQQGYFIKGKFDQFQRDRPLSAFLTAFRDLIARLTSESSTVIDRWRSELSEALGANGRLIIDLIPELARIIGDLPPIDELEPSAAQSRFNLTFTKFVRVFTLQERSLIIFLDDLQWADLASLNLIQSLMGESNIGSLMLIGAYRDREVNAAHPLSLKLQQIESVQQIDYLKLLPLNLSALNRAIADTLACSEELALPLSQLIWQKTAGNPFFSRQLLHFFHERGLINFDMGAGCWQCDLAQIKLSTIREDIVEFMTQKLQQLPQASQAVLKIAACMGNRFELDTLAIAVKKTAIETARELDRALQEGFILRVTEIYRFSSNNTSKTSEVNLAVPYQFLHDRVQQAAYALIPETERMVTHWQIGQLLLDRIPISEREANIFAIVNHLNHAVNLIQNPGKRRQIAELNLIAGGKAKAATAHSEAFDYLATGWQLLAADSWQTQYDLTLAINLALAEAAYLCGNFSEMESIVETILHQAKSLGDRTLAHEVRIQSQIARGNPLTAVKIALEVLGSLGYKFPLKPSKLKILLTLIKTKWDLRGKSIDNLIDLPSMSDPDILAAAKIMMLAGSSAFSSAIELVPLLALKGISLSVKYGNAPISTYGYSSYSIILCGVLGDITGGYRFGKLALDLVDKLNVPELKAKNLMLFNNFVRHWKEPLRAGSQSLLEAYTIGLETGDLEFACYSVYMHCYHAYFFGGELQELAEKMQTYGEVIKKFHQETILRLHRVYHQATLNLLGKNDDPCLLSGEIYDEITALPELQAANHRTALFDLYCHKLILCCFFDRAEEAVIYADMTKNYLDSAIATPSIPVFHFYDALARLAVYNFQGKQARIDFKKQIASDRDKLKYWAKYAPMNCLHRLHLIQAEIDRVEGKYLKAIANYDRAIQFAQQYEYVNELALARELTAKFYLTWNKPNLARSYFIDAYYSYANWGAKAKVDDLTKRYPSLLTPIFNSNLRSDTMTLSSEMANSSTWDLKAIIKTYQALSREIEVDKLLSTLMEAIIINSGAEKGYLVLFDREPDNLLITTKIIDGTPQIEIERQILASSDSKLPLSAITQVKNTLKSVTIAENIQQSHFIGDPYFSNNQPQSMICLPIFEHTALLRKTQKLIAIVYLENKLIKNVFTGDRLEILHSICSQVAISLENANLYENLKLSQVREKEKAERLERNLQQLQQTQQELLAIQQKLRHDAFHDSLTGLPNRAWLLELLERAINLAARHPDYLYAVLFLDLDRFKSINDSLGHLIGDELLKQVAQRLRLCVRNTDTVSRLGGDEFAILLEELEDPQEAVVVAQRIQEQFARSFNLEHHEIYAGTSIGITYSHLNYQQPSDILRDADAAMYRAKSQGKGRYVIFDPTMETNALDNLQLENSLRWAIARQEFCLYYQPIISLATGSLNGFEALIRWHHPVKGWIAPEEFIPIAEETGLVNNIGWWVIQSACSQLKTWRKLFPNKKITVNVNFSTVQLKQDGILEKLEKVCRENQLPDFVLKLEITESCILETFTSEAKILMQLKKLGIGLCIDDFGTGYSSLSRLHQFPIDTLKIDRSFVSHLGHHPQHFETIQTIITLAHSLGMDVVAEGVETTTQLERLQKLQCEYLQGYLFSKPVDSATATELLKQDSFLNN
jgi:diguanylate cyclase (GGDEF)-like protein